MKVVLLMDLANVTVPLSRQGRILDPLVTVKNLRQLPGMERISGLWAVADYQMEHYPQSLQRDLMSAGFQLIHAPRLSVGDSANKSTDDVELVSHADWLLDNCTTFDTVLLASGDRDFLRISQRFLNRGLNVSLVDPDLLVASRDLRNAVGNEVEIIAWKPASVSAIPATARTLRELCGLLFGPNPDPALVQRAMNSDYGVDAETDLLVAAHRCHEYIRRILIRQAERKKACTPRHLLNVLQGEVPIEFHSLKPVEGFTEQDYRTVMNSLETAGLIAVEERNDNGRPYYHLTAIPDHPYLQQASTGEKGCMVEGTAQLVGN